MSAPQPLKFSAFEEDDEFEEFEVEGMSARFARQHPNMHACVDWKKEEEEPTDMKLWEDNWDEDDFEDDFSKQLRQVKLYPTCISLSLSLSIYLSVGLFF